MMTLSIALILLACGGGAGETGAKIGFSGPNDPIVGPTAPSAPALTLTVGTKLLHLSWNTVAEATYYQVYETVENANLSAKIADNLTQTTFTKEIVVHELNWANTRYRVDACNGFGCTPSNLANPLQSMVETIGTVQGSITELGDLFGTSVALSADGSTLAVGAENEESGRGAVYIFVRTGTSWIQEGDPIYASAPDAGDHFGCSLALSDNGNILVVGAKFEDGNGENGDPMDNSQTDAGAAYVYSRAAAVWSHQAYLKGTIVGEKAYFGSSVDINAAGTLIAVGAPGEGFQGAMPGAGVAFVFSRSGSDWTELSGGIYPTNLGEDDRFGSAVALNSSGDLMAVGAPNEDGGSDTGPNIQNSGAVYLFNPNILSTWKELNYLRASNAGPEDRFGWSLALSGDGNSLVVGAPFEDGSSKGIGQQTNDLAPNAGAIYLFTYSENTWGGETYVKASNAGSGDFFGWSVTLNQDGSLFAVGARDEAGGSTGINGGDNNSKPNSGAVYTFRRSDINWSQEAYVKAPIVNEDAHFGASVCLDNDGSTMAVGATGGDYAYLY